MKLTDVLTAIPNHQRIIIEDYRDRKDFYAWLLDADKERELRNLPLDAEVEEILSGDKNTVVVRLKEE